MDKIEYIDAGRLGMALGLTAGAFFLGCSFVMSFAEREIISLFMNSIAHGFNMGAIMHSAVGVMETITGLINTLALGWLSGVLIGLLYNWTARRKLWSAEY